MYFKKLKDARQHQKNNGGVIWYDNIKNMYYIL